MKTRIIQSIACVTLATGLVAATAQAGKKCSQAGQKDIVDTAVGAGSFNTLATALTAAGLVDALKADGPYTVFAPTDEAFAKLPEGALQDLLKPENKDKLVDILTYHVVKGSVPAATAVTLTSADALNSKKIKVKKKGDNLFLNKSKVVKTDIQCSNGIIHVVDTVLLPPAKKAKQASSTSHHTRQMLMTAINTGVPLYNRGHHRACSDVYKMACLALMNAPEASKHTKRTLRMAMARAEKQHRSGDQAWTMRRAFDSLLASN